MQMRGEEGLLRFEKPIERKIARIAKHDAKLRKKQPGRNISIPDAGA
jgi:hypothetical protein